MASSVTIDVLSVYTRYNNGFIEVEFYVGTSKRDLIYQTFIETVMAITGHDDDVFVLFLTEGLDIIMAYTSTYQ